MNRIIDIRPYKGGWQCWEGDGVGPYWLGEAAQQDAKNYAKARAKTGRCEIRVLNAAAETAETLSCPRDKF